MIALAVLAVGIAAIFGMVVHVSKANRTMVLQTRSVDAFAQLAAEIQNAKCDFDANDPTNAALFNRDPGLTPNNTWITAPVGGSSIQYVGATDGTQLPPTTPIMQIDYKVDVDPQGATDVQVYDVEIRIQDVTPGGRVGDGMRIYPVRKLCNARLDTTARGEYL